MPKKKRGAAPPGQPPKEDRLSNHTSPLETVNLLDMLAAGGDPPLELVRLDRNETAVIPFTADGPRVNLHFCKEADINAYIVCNGEECILCRTGRDRAERILIPVYLPVSQTVGILPVGLSLRPFALLPQLGALLKADTRKVIFITRDGGNFLVSTRDFPEDTDDGAAAIRAYLDNYEAGRIDLIGVYPRMSNEQLLEIPEIARSAALKGLGGNEGDSRK